MDKFTNGIRIVQGGKAIEGFFRNDAPYAYAIKPASYSKRENGSPPTVAEAEESSQRNHVKPAKKNVNKLVKRLADAFIADQKKKDEPMSDVNKTISIQYRAEVQNLVNGLKKGWPS